jgi:hypothetical protein
LIIKKQGRLFRLPCLAIQTFSPKTTDWSLCKTVPAYWSHENQRTDSYPTDIYAGRVLAQAIVRKMKENPDFQKDFAGAKAEIAAAQVANNSR